MASPPIRPAQGDGAPTDHVQQPSRPVDAYAETLAPDVTPRRTTDHPSVAQTAAMGTLSGVIPPIGSETLTFKDDSPEAVAARVEIPGYEIEAQLGHGGMGVVFRARHVRLNRLVAIKMILGGQYASSEARIRFLTEAEAIAKLHHPHIVQVYEFGQHEGFPYFTLEFLEGGTLERLLGGTPLAPKRAAQLVKQLAHAVQHAHDRGIIHRDLKPSNILMDVDETPKISDFGLAKQTAGGSGMTQSGSILGTPSYMAPEQASGHVRQIGPHSDVYALGAILYECLTGRPPFRGSTTMETINQVMTQEPVAPRRLVPTAPRDLETLCLKCLQKNPANRYASATDLAADLERYLNGEAIKARPIGPIQRTVRWAKRHPSAAALVGVVGLAAVALLLGSWWYSLQLASALTVAEDRRREADTQRIEAEAQRLEAETQKREAQTQKKEADAQKALVAANLQRRLDVVDDMLGNLDARLAQKSGMESVRMEFLTEFLKISKQLLAEQGSDPAVRRQAGRLYSSIGDLWLEGNRFRDGETAYAEAVKLQKGLADEFPTQVEYQTDYATTCLNRAVLLWLGKRPAQGRDSAVLAVAVMDRLVEKSPGDLTYQKKAARYRFFLANILEDAGKPGEAPAMYEAALVRQDDLVKSNPSRTDLLGDQAATLAGLGLALEATDKPAARRYLERAMTVRRQAKKLGPAEKALATAWQDSTADLANLYRRNGFHAELLALAEVMALDATENRTDNYDAACIVGYAAETLRANKTLPADQRAAAMEAYAARALVLLQRAVEAGFTDRAHIGSDPDLDAIRDRPDFQQFLDQLAVRFPNRPVTLAARFDALEGIYVTAEQTYRRLSSSARTVAEKKRARDARISFADFGNRILTLAEKNPESPASLEALVWVLETAPTASGPDTPTGKLLRRVLAALRRDHLTKPDLVNACRVLAGGSHPGGDEVLRAAQGPASPREVRGVAAYALALSLMGQAERGEDADPERAAELTNKAEQQLEAVIRDHDAVPFQDRTLGDAARKKLVELRTLSVGRVARDIEGNDLNGSPMKLSDFRGQVVLLDFWANWCGFCRAMYPHERLLVERMKGKPFALVGINCDETPAEAKRAVDRNKLTWRSWFDATVVGGRATEKWQIDGYPALVLLDQNGVIRKKWSNRPDDAELDAAIEQLLREANAGKK